MYKLDNSQGRTLSRWDVTDSVAQQSNTPMDKLKNDVYWCFCRFFPHLELRCVRFKRGFPARFQDNRGYHPALSPVRCGEGQVRQHLTGSGSSIAMGSRGYPTQRGTASENHGTYGETMGTLLLLSFGCFMFERGNTKQIILGSYTWMKRTAVYLLEGSGCGAQGLHCTPLEYWHTQHHPAVVPGPSAHPLNLGGEVHGCDWKLGDASQSIKNEGTPSWNNIQIASEPTAFDEFVPSIHPHFGLRLFWMISGVGMWLLRSQPFILAIYNIL